jgi:uroporphyrinogen-III synthase
LSLPLIIVRPEPGASATADRAETLGLQPIKRPVFEITPLDWSPLNPADFDALLVTSANAMRHGGAGLAALHGLPVLAVGDATARAAQETCFANITAGNGDGPALVRLAVDAGYRRLLHLCGHNHRTLDTENADITSIHVYAATPIEPPPQLPASGVILAHSPRAVALVSDLITDRTPPPHRRDQRSRPRQGRPGLGQRPSRSPAN